MTRSWLRSLWSRAADRRRAQPGAQLRLIALEGRLTPAVTVLSQGGDLTITGTPTAISQPFTVGWNEALTVARVSGNQYTVTDGKTVVGTYSATRNITFKLASIDNDIVLDVADGQLNGDVRIDLGVGDRDTTTASTVAFAGGGGLVKGGVSFVGSSSHELFAVGAKIDYVSFDIIGPNGLETYYFTDQVDSPVTVRKDVTAVGKPVTIPFEDSFYLGGGSVVERDVVTQRVTYTEIHGEVKRDLTALTTDSPGGIGLLAFGKVGRDLYATGGATEPGYFSIAIVAGEVGRDAQVDITAGSVSSDMSAIVGRDYRFTTNGDSAYASVIGTVGRDATMTFATPAGTANQFDLFGNVARDLAVVDGPGDLGVNFGVTFVFPDPETGEIVVLPFPGTAGRFATVLAGNGNNFLAFDGTSGSTVGTALTYVGGSGDDFLLIDGNNDFGLIAFMGGGNDVVAFTTTARVNYALIVFGTNGTKTWEPPTVVNFPGFLVNYP